MVVAMILISGWALYNRNRDDVRRDWRQLALLVLGHTLLIVVVGSILLFPRYLAIIATGTLALIIILWIYGRPSR